MTTLTPYDTPQTKLEINGVISPGICTVECGGYEYAWETRKGDSTAGAKKVFKGRSLATAKCTFRLFSAEDRADWQRFVAAIRYDETAKAGSLRGYQVSHPQLEDIPGCASWTVKSIVTPQPAASGVWVASIELEEDRAPRETAVGVKGSTAPKPKLGAEDPKDPLVAALKAKRDALAAKEAEAARKTKELAAKEAAAKAASGLI